MRLRPHHVDSEPRAVATPCAAYRRRAFVLEPRVLTTAPTANAYTLLQPELLSTRKVDSPARNTR